jgi:hypothetical protein
MLLAEVEICRTLVKKYAPPSETLNYFNSIWEGVTLADTNVTAFE